MKRIMLLVAALLCTHAVYALAPEVRGKLLNALNSLPSIKLVVEDISTDASGDEYAEVLFEQANRVTAPASKAIVYNAILGMRMPNISKETRKKANDLSDAASLATLQPVIIKLVPAPKKSEEAVSIEAGPLWDQDHAVKTCPDLCKKNNKDWTGHWWTTVPTQMSVCQCKNK